MKRVIWIILGVSLFLRLAGVNYGFPNFLISDERALVFGALKMIELKTLVPAFYPEEFRPLYYMPFMSYVFLIWLLPFLAVKYALAGFPAFSDFKTALVLDPSSIWIWSRALIAMLGTLNVYTIYLISRKIFHNERAAIFSAAFLAVSFFHVELSHMTRHWMPAITLTYLVWLLFLYIREQDKLKNYIWGGLAAGAAFVTNPSSVALFVPFGVFQIEKRKIFSKNAFIFIALFTLCSLLFILLHPFGVTFAEPTKGGSGPSENLLWRVTHVFSTGFGGLAANIQLYGQTLLKYDIALFIFAILGFCLAYLCKVNRVILLAAILFAVSYIVIIYMMLISFSRPVIMLLPIFAIWAGFAVSQILVKFPRFRTLGSLVIFAVFGYSLAIDLQYDYLLSKKDNRTIATDWISENIPVGSKILASLPYMRLPNSKKGILEMQAIDSGSLRSTDHALLGLADDKYPQPSFEVLNLHFISTAVGYRKENDAEFFRKKGYEYFIIEYANDDMSDLDAQSKLRVGQAELIKRFPGTYDLRDEISSIWPWEIFKYDRFGPNIDVYEL